MTQFQFISHTLYDFLFPQATTSHCQWPACKLCNPAFSSRATRGRPLHSGSPGCPVNPLISVKLSHRASAPPSSAAAPLSAAPSWPPQAHLASPPAFSLHEGQAEVPGALDAAPPPLRLASPGDLEDLRGLKDLGQQLCHDVSTLTGERKAPF